MLVFSDIPRSGLGVRTFANVYPRLELETTVFFGAPWNYTVFEATMDAARSRSARVWSYKFDTTSIAWRAFAQYFKVPSFPACMLYREECIGDVFGGEVAFRMIDDLIEVLANSAPTARDRGGPVATMLRTSNVYVDRVHNRLLPNLFPNRNWRTNQALHYSSEQLARMSAADICFPPASAATPNFCKELWINFRRSCSLSEPNCRDVGLLYVHAFERVRKIQDRFPNLSVDLTLLESQEDFQVGKGGISALGIRRADVTSVIRARECDSTCTTWFASDYRYEVGLMVSDGVEWFRLVAALRVVGQSYFLLRAIGLVLSCYFAFGVLDQASDERFIDRFHSTRRLLMKVPTQCIVFGSTLPIALYTAAHAIDASLMYTVLENRFISQNGVLDISFIDFITVAVIQMRSRWLYALLWHAIVATRTRARWIGQFDISGGVIGVPAFFLTVISVVAVSAQFRSTTFRCSNILAIYEGAARPSTLASMRQQQFFNLGSGMRQLGGITIDVKYLICILTPLLAVLLARSLVLLTLQWQGQSVIAPHWPLGTTPVPYSAGVLWPTVSLSVHWTSGFFCIHEQPQSSLDRRLGRVLPSTTSAVAIASFHLLAARNRSSVAFGVGRMRLQTFRYIQRRLQRLEARGDDVEANVAFMNLVLLSDPIVFFKVCVASGAPTLGYYRSTRHSQHVVLLPMEVIAGSSEHTAPLRMLREVDVNTLHWSELIQCG